MRQILFEFWLFLASIDWGAAQAQARVGGAGSADPLQCRHSPWILASDWSGLAILSSDWSLTTDTPFLSLMSGGISQSGPCSIPRADVVVATLLRFCSIQELIK